jgi:hypothetical protein
MDEKPDPAHDSAAEMLPAAARTRLSVVVLGSLFVVGAIVGVLGYVLYPFNAPGPWTEELAFQQGLWSGVAMLGYVMAGASGIALVVCLLRGRR